MFAVNKNEFKPNHNFRLKICGYERELVGLNDDDKVLLSNSAKRSGVEGGLVRCKVNMQMIVVY